MDIDYSEQIFKLAKQYKNICISVHDFTNLLRDGNHTKIDPTIDREILRVGLYCKIGNCNVWVSSATLGPGFAQISDEQITSTNSKFKKEEEHKWSPIFSLSDIKE